MFVGLLFVVVVSFIFVFYSFDPAAPFSMSDLLSSFFFFFIFFLFFFFFFFFLFLFCVVGLLFLPTGVAPSTMLH